MSFTSFGVKSKVKKQTGALRKTPIAEFAEPSAEQDEDQAQPISPEESEREADELQVRMPNKVNFIMC